MRHIDKATTHSLVQHKFICQYLLNVIFQLFLNSIGHRWLLVYGKSSLNLSSNKFEQFQNKPTFYTKSNNYYK